MPRYNPKPTYKRQVFTDDETQTNVPRKTWLLRQKTEETRPQSGEKDEESLSGQSDTEEKDKNVGDDICLMCGVFGKNRELWLRCVSCGMWAHKACANIERKVYTCDYCM